MAGHPDEIAREHVADLRVDLGARAAGLWWVAGDKLEQITFSASPNLSREVVLDFTKATRSVPLTQTDLGIVQAIKNGTMIISRRPEQPEDSGSGHWLRAFDAVRSIAVPLRNAQGKIKAVLAVALPDDSPDDQEVAQRMLRDVQRWDWLI